MLRVQAWRFHSSAPREVESIGLVHDDGTIARYGDLREPNTPGYEMTGDMGWRPAGMLGVLGVANSTFRIPDGFHFEVPQDHEIDFELRFRPSGIDKPFTATLDAEPPAQQTSRALHLIPLSIRSWRVKAGESESSNSDGSVQLILTFLWFLYERDEGSEVASAWMERVFEIRTGIHIGSKPGRSPIFELPKARKLWPHSVLTTPKRTPETQRHHPVISSLGGEPEHSEYGFMRQHRPC